MENAWVISLNAETKLAGSKISQREKIILRHIILTKFSTQNIRITLLQKIRVVQRVWNSAAIY